MSNLEQRRESPRRRIGNDRWRGFALTVAPMACMFVYDGGWSWLLASLAMGNMIVSDEWDGSAMTTATQMRSVAVGQRWRSHPSQTKLGSGGGLRMSSPEQRRNSPRRRVGSMHPGWACFLAAFGSGLFVIPAMVFWVKYMVGQSDIWTPLFFTFISFTLFLASGRKAEKLWEREP